MSKKSIAFLVFAIIFFVFAVGIFAYSKIIDSNDNTAYSHESDSEVNLTEDSLAEDDENEQNQEFIFYNAEGDELKISDFDENPIVVILWNSNSDNSYEIFEMIENIYSEYESQVTFLPINTGEADKDIMEVIANCNYSFEVYYDLDDLVSEFFSYDVIPTLIFYESDGTISNQVESTITEDSFLANLDLIAGNY